MAKSKTINVKAKATGTEKTSRKLGKIDKSIKSMGMSAVKAGAAFFGAQALISGLKASIRLAGEQEQAEKKLETALGRTSQSLLAHASALQKQTAFGDEAIIGVQASIAAFIKDEDQIKKATEATLDLSVATGMDLKSAGDLVAKTLGSSLNAMSRYGVAVDGAVGSTERLESLTNNVAKLFGGQAKAQADTMTGALDQMHNALGDVAENIGLSLSPLIIGLADGIKNLATETGAEQKEARTLFNTLKDLTATEEVRERAMQSINEQYADYLPHLLDESSTLAEIERAQDRVTGAMLKRLALTINEEKIADLMRTKLALTGAEPGLIDANALAYKRYQDAVIQGMRNADVLAESQDQNYANFTAQSIASGIALENLNKNREDQKEVQAEINKLNEDAVTLAESFSETILKMPERPVFDLFDDEEIDILPDVIINMQEMVDMMDEAFGTEDDKTDKSLNRKINGARELSSVLDGIFDPETTGGEVIKDMALQLLNLFEGVVISSGAVNTALSAIWTGPVGWGAIIGSLALLEGAKAGVRALEFADGGIVPGQGSGDTVPAMLTPGEVILNQAQQQNLVGGMGGVTINISAPLVDETVIDHIIPAIQKAHRMNLA